MKIKNHLLTGEGVDFVKSPNHDGRFGENLPDTVIIHYTAGSSRESSVKTLCNPQHKASAHLVIGRDGLVTQLVPFNVIAYHAGPSAYGGRKGFNKYSIGIEIDNAGRLSRTGDGFISWFQKVYPAGEVIEAVHRNEKKPSF
ncbi:MAG: N-acetylmuramoyl-L-alanine amidase [Calditrichia bacterium]